MAKFVIFGEIGTNEVKWKIPNFEILRKELLNNNNNNEFSSMDISKKYTLKMYQYDSTYNVQGQGYPASHYFSIYMDNNSNQANLNSVIRVELITFGGCKIQREFDIGTKNSGRGLGFPRRFALRSLGTNYASLNTIEIVWTPEKVISEPALQPIFKPVSKPAGDGVVDDLEKAFSNIQFSDIQLLCNREKFDCHKFVLAARSPVFHAMFIHEMKENINKEVKLDSMKPKILKEMLSYIYCGKVKDLKETCDGMELLKVADQYQLEGLKEICGSFLSSNLKADNALDLLTLAESCNENHLKKSTMDWLVKNQNIKSLMKTKRWEELEDKFPRLLVDVMKVVVDQKL